MEDGFSGLKISNTTSINNDTESILAKILKNYILPKSETIETEMSTSSFRYPLSNHREPFINESNLSQTSDKENLDIPDLSFHKNKIIKKEMFFTRILRKFKESQAIAIASTSTTVKKTPEEIFNEKYENMKKELEAIEPQKKKDVFPGYSKKVSEDITHLMCGQQNEYIFKGKNIRKSDLRTVYMSTSWLNDEVINHYLNMIIEREPNALHSFDTFFYTKLS